MISVQNLAKTAYEAYANHNPSITVFRQTNGQPYAWKDLSPTEQSCWQDVVQALRMAMATVH
jgi:hypothetical protein